MHKILFLVLIALIYYFQAQLKSGHGGLEDQLRVEKMIAAQKKDNLTLYQRNEMMELKIAALKGSNDSIEARARYELNMVKPGETLVLLPLDDESK